MTRASRSRCTGSARTTGTTSTRTSSACRTCWRRSSRTRSARSRRAPSLDGIEGGTMGAQHPVSFCKDYQGGRSFYTALGNTPEAFDATLTTHLKGAITWAAGTADPVYSDCGATVLANYQQTKIGSPPNLQEPIGFDQLPDGRILQTDRLGSLRLHDATTGTTKVIANFADPALPLDAAHLLGRRGRALRPGGRRELRDQQVGLPVLLAADGHRREAVHGRDRRRRPRPTRTRRTRRRRRPRGIRTSATTSSRASSSSRTRTARGWT